MNSMSPCLLLTGANGFLGQAIVRQWAGRGKLYLLVRDSCNETAAERFEPVAEQLRSEGVSVEYEVLSCDLTDANLGLEGDVLARVLSEVSHVANCAGNVRFDLHPCGAIENNVHSAVNVVNFAARCEKIGKGRLVHVSTAYVSPPKPSGGLEHPGVSAIEVGYEESRGHHHNTYTWSKCIAEHHVASISKESNLSLSIVRPSIIGPAWTSPYPGWCSGNGSPCVNAIILFAAGVLRVMQRTGATNIIPVDWVANMVVDALLRDDAVEFYMATMPHSHAYPMRESFVKYSPENIDYFNCHPEFQYRAVNVIYAEGVLARALELLFEDSHALVLKMMRQKKASKLMVLALHTRDSVLKPYSTQTWHFDPQADVGSKLWPRNASVFFDQYAKTCCESAADTMRKYKRSTLRPRMGNWINGIVYVCLLATVACIGLGSVHLARSCVVSAYENEVKVFDPHHVSGTRMMVENSLLSDLFHPTGRIVATLVVVFICALYHRTKPLRVESTLPGPRPWYPWLGNLLHRLKNHDNWPEESTRLAKLYGRTWGGPLPNFIGGALPGAHFYVHDEANIRYVLQTNFNNYIKGEVLSNIFGELLGRGIFLADGDLWRVHRKLTSNMFSRNFLRHSLVVTRNKLLELLDVFQFKAAEAAKSSEEGFEIDFQSMFFRLMMDSISIIAFDVDLNSMRREEQHSFALAFDELQMLSHRRFGDPFFPIKRMFQLTEKERRVRELKKILDNFAYDVISRKRRTGDKTSPLGPDLLSRFIEHGRKTNEEVSDSELRDVILNIMIAGRDTTACALSWAFYELTRHPQVMQKVIDEVKSVCGTGEDAEFSFDTMAKLEYTHCVALEVLRLHPSVPNDPRFAVKDDVLPDGTKIPAGAAIGLCLYAMGRKEDAWGDNAMQFKPERFLEMGEPSQYKLPVFNAGPRLCLGRPLALMNMKLAMSMLLTSGFTFEDRAGHSGEYFVTLVQCMKGGFPIYVTKRKEPFSL